ncbi:DUF6325 family protein [Gordonia sp. PKS22-38]|uniref:DUF6325 family protein n=1 Tax=Gordonia prachuapensis TaxID=3115651 RepID=A0ABU7MW21_9ACTN|nr:DUF6325 family protein [Gordonia sp. PKS22-38]
MGEPTGPELTELGPIDYVVVELPDGATSLTVDMADQIRVSVESGTLRLLDLLIIERAESGELAVTEFEDLPDPRLHNMDAELVEILAAEDVENLSSAITPGRRAAVIVWEYLSAASFAAAARASGGKLVAQGRIPTQAIVATLRADDEPDR